MSDTSLNKYLAQGDDAAEAAFTPDPVTGTTPEQAVLFVNSETPATPVLKWWDGANFIDVSGGGGGGGTTSLGVVNGRLTTESGVPVSTSDRTAQGTLYFTPYAGNQIGLYDGADWHLLTFAELSISATGTAGGKNRDVFVDYNGGTPQLVLGTEWTNDTTRAVALTLQDGVYVLTGATDHRYIGTIRTTSTTTTEDSLQNRFVWNAYNRVDRRAYTRATGNWNTTSATFRELNNSSSFRLNLLFGLAEDAFDVTSQLLAQYNAGSPIYQLSIGEDSATTPSSTAAGSLTALAPFSPTGTIEVVAALSVTAALGFHFYTNLEAQATGGSTATAYGDAGGVTYHRLSAIIRN